MILKTPLQKIESRLCGATFMLLFLAVAACSGAEELTLEQEVNEFTISLTSDAFTDGEAIPRLHSCQGEDVSPPLRWSGVPDGAKSLALILDDPDASEGTWVHWVLFSLPPDITGLPEGVPNIAVIPEGATNGTNDYDTLGYGGPCLWGERDPHRFLFQLYALDNDPGLQSSATKADLFKAIDGHILAAGRLTGSYKNPCVSKSPGATGRAC